ncbi:MAG: hypothetical protein E7487_11720 [Ruminococcaceae bacterium]|nr:hypothetical protein [Oscillospiraceae bacterium]
MPRSRRNSFLKKFGASFRNYQFKSIFFQYFKIIFLAFSALILIAALIFFFTNRASRQKEYQLEAEKNFISYVNSFDLAMQRLSTTHYQLVKNTDLTLLLVRSGENFEEKNRTYITSLYQYLLNECASNSIFESIHIYLNNSDYIISSNVSRHRPLFHDTEWLQHVKTDSDIIFTRNIKSTNRRVITIIKPLSIGDTVHGYICYNLRYAFFGHLFGNILESPGQNDLSIFNAEDIYIFSSHAEKLGTHISDSPSLELPASYDSLLADDIAVYVLGDTTVLHYRSFFEEVTLLYHIRNTGFPGALQAVFLSLLIAVPVALLLCALLSALIALHMYDHIFRILKFFESSTYSPTENDRNEIAEIHRHILNITFQQRSLENEFAQKLIELKKAQTIALQTQINPHFLLNSLQMLCFTLLRERPEDSASLKIISLISEILRSNLNTHDYMVDLRSELTVTQKYLEIESLRNGGMFRVCWNTPPETLDKRILRFTLQPILENCILHGLSESKKEDKVITLSSSLEKNDARGFIVINITDNGVGMDTETLTELRHRLTLNYMPEKKEIGIANVNLRLKLLFGSDAAILVDSQRNEGTSVTVKIPLIG